MKSWSSTQKTIALSSGEAELTALVKCSCEVIGLLQLAADWDYKYTGQVHVDSTAALGVVGRRGAGKLRHVRVGQLWVQQKREDGELIYRKVKGTQNPADAMTKPLIQADMERYMNMLSHYAVEGRADKGLEMACRLAAASKKSFRVKGKPSTKEECKTSEPCRTQFGHVSAMDVDTHL